LGRWTYAFVFHPLTYSHGSGSFSPLHRCPSAGRRPVARTRQAHTADRHRHPHEFSRRGRGFCKVVPFALPGSTCAPSPPSPSLRRFLSHCHRRQWDIFSVRAPARPTGTPYSTPLFADLPSLMSGRSAVSRPQQLMTGSSRWTRPQVLPSLQWSGMTSMY